ncbi:MAG TPA: hypothetical protein VNJ70_00245 [Thermoanaerobaculia bacterium]|nr:hypothetical protein [Thermoanaerobaculia bacterium]
MADKPDKAASKQLVPVRLVRERKPGAKGGAARLWVKEPESQVEDPSLLAARLCSCSDVCLAVIEDR